MIALDETDKVSLLSEHTVIKMNNENNYAKLVVVIIEFISIGEVDTTNEKYDAEVKIISKWIDDEEIDEYDKKKHWYPQLFIVNAFYDVKEDILYHVDRFENKSIITETRIAKGLNYIINSFNYKKIALYILNLLIHPLNLLLFYMKLLANSKMTNFRLYFTEFFFF